MTLAPAILVETFGMSDLGKVRKNNEDSFAIGNLTTAEADLTPALMQHTLGNRGSLFMVADGMGGAASGEVASQMCISHVPKYLEEHLALLTEVSEADFALRLRESVEYANQAIYQRAQNDPSSRGMGTTATVAALFGPRLFVAQVGDSRAYLVRGSGMAQLTRDQTLLNYLREIGVAVSAGPEMDSRKNILTQAVGSSAKVDVKVTSSPIQQGDRLLLCSDGLYNMVDDDAILATLGRTAPLAHKCQSLIAQANSAGGLDNVTVVLAEFSGPGLPPASPSLPIECKELA